MSQEIIQKVKALIDTTPPLSQTTSQLLATIGEPQHSLNDIVAIVETDSILTSLVLKTVNSSVYGLPHEIETVTEAVRYLGDTVVAGLALKSEKSDIYNSDLSGYLAESDENWAHSLKTAIAARHFAKRFSEGTVKESVAYTAGIVHDIGKTLISGFLDTEQQDLLMQNEFIEMEKDLIGISHDYAGAMLADKWKLPQAIKEVIQYHHTPSKAGDQYKKLVYIVHLADITAMMSGSGTGADSMRHTIAPDYTDYLSISEMELEQAYFEIHLEYQKTFKAIQNTFDSQNDSEEGGDEQ